MDLPGLYKFIDGKPSNLALVEKLLEQGAGARQLATPDFRTLNTLAIEYAADSQTMQRLTSLESKHFRLSDLAVFISQSSENAMS